MSSTFENSRIFFLNFSIQVHAGVLMAKAMYLVAVNVASTVESVHQNAIIVTDLIFYRFIMRFCENKLKNTLMSVNIKSNVFVCFNILATNRKKPSSVIHLAFLLLESSNSREIMSKNAQAIFINYRMSTAHKLQSFQVHFQSSIDQTPYANLQACTHRTNL